MTLLQTENIKNAHPLQRGRLSKEVLGIWLWSMPVGTVDVISHLECFFSLQAYEYSNIQNKM